MRIGRFALAALVFVAACAPRQQLTTLRRHPDLLSREQPLHDVAVVPPEVIVVETQFVGDIERLDETERDFEAQLTRAVGDAFRAKGYEVSPARLDGPDLSHEETLRRRLSLLEQSARQLAFKLYRKGGLPPDEAQGFRASIGPQVNPFAERADADALVLVQMQAAIKSSGRQYADTFWILLAAAGGTYYNPPDAGAILTVILVDGISGELLWSNRVWMVFDDRIDVPRIVHVVVDPMPTAERQALK